MPSFFFVLQIRRLHETVKFKYFNLNKVSFRVKRCTKYDFIYKVQKAAHVAFITWLNLTPIDRDWVTLKTGEKWFI